MSLNPSPAPHTVQQCGTEKRKQQDNTTTSNEGMAPKKKARDGRAKIYIGGYKYTRANITSVNISYWCSFYRSQECPGKIEFFSSIMDYDVENMAEHVCAPLSRPSLNDRARSETHDVTAAMKREINRLAVAGTFTPQQIWDSVRDSFYARDDDLVI
ncbi:Dual specificity protein phosphatase, partial [Globisporangium splendens]